MKRAYAGINPTATPQTEPIPGAGQVANAGGGHGWQIDDWSRLMRFLILGSEGGTYYKGERQHTAENVATITRCLEADGMRAIQYVLDVSTEGRAVRNSPALLVLAMAAGFHAADDDKALQQAVALVNKTKADGPGEIQQRRFDLAHDALRETQANNARHNEVRRHALASLPAVARTATHLFEFLTYVKQFRGWGRGLRDAVANWYNKRSPDGVGLQMIKYRNREGWQHRDALRLSHPVPSDPDHALLYHLAIHDELRNDINAELPNVVAAYRHISSLGSGTQRETIHTAGEIIRGHRLPREAVPTELLTSPDVWDALLDDMPLTAMIRNLGNMGKVGLLVPGNWDAIKRVVDALGDAERLASARVHPISILGAQGVYGSGSGVRGSGSWPVVPQVVDALDAAFYQAFKNVQPTGKRYLVGVDVSGSMDWAASAPMPGLTPRVLAGAMGMVWLRTEPMTAIMGFSHQLAPLNISARMRLDDVCRVMATTPMGATNCALPMEWALANKMPVDVFVVITDNETNTGRQHPAQALAAYRKAMGINAKLAVLAMSASEFSIADPRDPGMMDFVGFDSSTPQAVAEFAKF